MQKSRRLIKIGKWNMVFHIPVKYNQCWCASNPKNAKLWNVLKWICKFSICTTNKLRHARFASTPRAIICCFRSLRLFSSHDRVQKSRIFNVPFKILLTIYFMNCWNRMKSRTTKNNNPKEEDFFIFEVTINLLLDVESGFIISKVRRSVLKKYPTG